MLRLAADAGAAVTAAPRRRATGRPRPYVVAGCRGLGRAVARALFRLEVTGTEHVPRDRTGAAGGQPQRLPRRPAGVPRLTRGRPRCSPSRRSSPGSGRGCSAGSGSSRCTAGWPTGTRSGPAWRCCRPGARSACSPRARGGAGSSSRSTTGSPTWRCARGRRSSRSRWSGPRPPGRAGPGCRGCGRRYGSCSGRPCSVDVEGDPRSRRTVAVAAEQLRVALVTHLRAATEEST